MTSSSAATRGMMFFPVVVAAAMMRLVRAGQRHDQRRGRLGQHVRVGRRVGQQHLLDAVEFRRRLRDGFAVLTGDQNMHVGADRLGRGQRLVGGVLERSVVVLGEKKGGHYFLRAPSVTLRYERSEPRRATAAKSAIADLDIKLPKSGSRFRLAPLPTSFEGRFAATSG